MFEPEENLISESTVLSIPKLKITTMESNLSISTSQETIKKIDIENFEIQENRRDREKGKWPPRVSIKGPRHKIERESTIVTISGKTKLSKLI